MINKKSFLIIFFSCINLLYSQDRQLPILRTEGFDRSANLQNSYDRDSLLSRFAKNSTSANKNPDAKIEDYLIITRKNDTLIVDTTLTIEKYYKQNFLRKDNFDLLPFSNTGVAYNSLTFSNDNSVKGKMGASNKYHAFETANDVVYYHLPTPFTELMYRSVFEQGQLLDAIYSVNTSKQFNFSISRKGLRSLGNYQNFISSSSNFKFTTNYSSKNKKYRFRTHYSNQKLNSEQNGGISDIDVENFENGDSQFLDRGVFDPNFENAYNEFLSKRFYFDHSYVLIEGDSLKTKKLELFNSIYFEENKYKYKQDLPDTFFGNSYESQEINDNIFLNSLNVEAKLFYAKDSIENINLGLKYIGDKYFLENFQISQFIDNSQSINSKTTFLTAGYYRRFSNIHLNIQSENYILGDNKSNLISSKILINLKRNNLIKIKYELLSTPPNYNTILHRSNYENYNWDNQFKNSISNTFGLRLELNKIFDLDLDLISVKKHIQFEKTISELQDGQPIYSIVPIQYNGDLDLLKVKLYKKVSFGKFSIDSRLLFQKSLSDDIVNVPDFVTRNSIYFSSEMFKKALYLQTGFSVKYFSKYFMNGYDPLLSELYIQKEKKIGEFPLIDFFINAKIQQTRLYFKLEHFNSSFTGYNYYSAPNYPYRDFTFRFGLVWNFFM